MNTRPDDELAARHPVWVALASMFLNTDVALTRGARAQALAASPTVIRLRELARLAVPHSSEWRDTLAAVAVLRAP